MRVSVLMTSFEHERFVAQALDGVLAQEGVENSGRTRPDGHRCPMASHVVAQQFGKSRVEPEWSERHDGSVERVVHPPTSTGSASTPVLSAI